MHEMSMAMEVCRIAEQHLVTAGAGAAPARLLELGLEVGDEAGVELENLLFCVEVLLAAPPFGGAKAVVKQVPGDVLRVTYLEVEDGGTND